MNQTLILSLRQHPELLQAYINALPATFQYAKYFPLKKKIDFKWATLADQKKGRNVAADVVADNNSTKRKSRPIFESATGDIPHLQISREMRRSEIKEYQVALALAQDANAKELIDYWANDAEFCFNGIHAELEFIAFALLSNAGVLSFSGTNNDGIATEFDLDYQVDAAQKLTTSVSFANAANGDFIGTCAQAVAAGKAIGQSIKHVFCNLQEFYKIQSLEQVIKASASFANNALNVSQVPDINQVNAMLAKQAHLNGIQLHVIDTEVTREIGGRADVTTNPFADNRLVFSPSEVLGTTQYDILNKNIPSAVIATRTLASVIKYSTPEPYAEVTIGDADAIPVLDTAYRNIYVKTDAQSW